VSAVCCTTNKLLRLITEQTFSTKVFYLFVSNIKVWVSSSITIYFVVLYLKMISRPSLMVYCQVSCDSIMLHSQRKLQITSVLFLVILFFWTFSVHVVVSFSFAPALITRVLHFCIYWYDVPHQPGLIKRVHRTENTIWGTKLLRPYRTHKQMAHKDNCHLACTPLAQNLSVFNTNL